MKVTGLIPFIALVCVQSSAWAGNSAPVTHIVADRNETKVQSIHVNARNLSQLPENRKYVVDLTRGDMIYDLDPAGRPIDFSRISVRTSAGNSELGSWLGRIFSKKELFEWQSLRFSIGTRQAFRAGGLSGFFGRSSSGALGFSCSRRSCVCRGASDCKDMLSTDICGIIIVCTDNKKDSCACGR